MNLKADYSFVVDLDYDSSRIEVVQNVNIVNRSNKSISTLNFSVIPKAFDEFNLRELKVDGNATSFDWTNNANLAVNLPYFVRSNEQVNVRLSYVLSPKSEISTYLKSSLSKANGVMQVSSWFPILSNGHAMRMPGDSQFTIIAESFHMELNLNRDMPVAAPGNITSPSNLRRIIDFGPARNFAFSVCPSCNFISGNIDGVRVKVFAQPGINSQAALTYAQNSLHTFINKFADYPYDNFILAQGSAPSFANEFPGIIFVGKNKMNARIIKHETAHQWFYGILGNDQMADPWLDEAFATWAGRGFIGHSYCSDKKVSSSIYDFPDRFDYSNDGACGSYNQTVYYKGADFVQGVRTRMGDERFFNSMRNLFREYRFQTLTNSMVINNWLEYARPDLRTSVRRYINRFIDW